MTIKSKKAINKVLILPICCGLFFLLFANGLFSLLRSPLNENLVYCPLQKIWIKPKSEVIANLEPLKNLCATDKRKAELAAEFSLKTLDIKTITENTVFDYLEKGDQALVNNFPHLPKDEISKSAKFETVANNFQRDFIKPNLSQITLSQLSRPPTYQTSGKFDFQITHNLDKISRHIKPRSPPLFS